MFLPSEDESGVFGDARELRVSDLLARAHARQAARSAAGVSQTYPQHAGNGGAAMTPDSMLAAFKARPLPCVDLGEKLPGQPCGSQLMQCKKFGDVTAQYAPCTGAARTCRDCPEYRT